MRRAPCCAELLCDVLRLVLCCAAVSFLERHHRLGLCFLCKFPTDGWLVQFLSGLPGDSL
jgi:hypothetical protein